MAMKAFMSTAHTDGQGRPDGPCEPCGRRQMFGWLALPTGPQRACEREARAILAEAEPQTSMDAPTGLFSIKAFTIAAHLPGPAWRAERTAGRAIAESLAAFVALEIG